MKTQLTLEGVECTMESESRIYGRPFYIIRHAGTGEIIVHGIYAQACKDYATGTIKKFKSEIEKCFQDKWKREMMLNAIKDFEDGKQTAP